MCVCVCVHVQMYVRDVCVYMCCVLFNILPHSWSQNGIIIKLAQAINASIM